MDSRLLAVVLTGLLSFVVALPGDFDGDGLSTWDEWRQGTATFDRDTDGDGVEDRLELRAGTRPTQRDTDGDGLGDGDERRIGSDPRQPDMDGDGLLDGAEGAALCIVRTDCDDDGLPDAQETDGFDPLRADSFDVGLQDVVVWAFAQSGQPAGPDNDLDGIPDAWEDAAGRITWGPFDPQPGERDLLVEYLKVTGPSSGRFSLDFTPAYQAVAAMFADAGIRLQWIETPIVLANEHRPGFLEGDDLGYYRAILTEGQASANPYVTSIVLNPQQQQEDLAGDVLGAAFLRSMIATVDYGAHVAISFAEADSNGIQLTGGNIEVSPSLESHILGAPRQQVRQIAFASEGIVGLGETPTGVYLVTRQGGTDFRWDWRNDWFVSAPNITTSDGAYLQLRVAGATLDGATLAQTIAHELGHTLGLCHAHEAECYLEFDPADVSQRTVDSTTMSYTAAPGTLHFLASEWRQVAEYLTCPPQDPIRLLATGAPLDALLFSKYEASFMQAQSLRACGDTTAINADLTPDDGSDRSPGRDGVGAVWLYSLGTVVVAAFAAWRTQAR